MKSGISPGRLTVLFFIYSLTLHPQILSVSNSHIVLNQKPLLLKGFGFGNEVWNYTAADAPVSHHSQQDYITLKNGSFNSIRLYMNYRWFEEDEEPYTYKPQAFTWLSNNLTWAAEHGIYLILNMHVPQGGYQSGGGGDALWNDMENQLRLTELWKAIARFCRGNPAVAGYGLLNEPYPVSSADQWESLARQITKAVRSVDAEHLIFTERAMAVKQDSASWSQMNFPDTGDALQVLEFHFYEPFAFTHQGASWTGMANKDGGSWPDELALIDPPDLTWGGIFCSSADFKTEVWQEVSTGWTVHSGAEALYIYPLMQSVGESGSVQITHVVLEEKNSQGQTTSVIKVSGKELQTWKLWSADTSGKTEMLRDPKTGGDYLTLKQTGQDANVSDWFFRMPAKSNFSYRFTAKVKTVSPAGVNRLRLDYQKSASGQNPAKRNITYLRSQIKSYAAEAEKLAMPVYCGEFGAINKAFENNKGGGRYIADMMEVLTEADIHFSIHSWHENVFGLFTGSSLPSAESLNREFYRAVFKKDF